MGVRQSSHVRADALVRQALPIEVGPEEDAPISDLQPILERIWGEPEDDIPDGISRYGFWGRKMSGATCPIVVGSPEFWDHVPFAWVSLTAQPINACQFQLSRSHLVESVINVHSSDYEPGAYKNPLMAVHNGELWCRDGHHRITAAMLLWDAGIGPDQIWARVYDMDSVAQAAGL